MVHYQLECGIYDAASYANRQSYYHDYEGTNTIRNNAVFNHGNANLKIGKYYDTNSTTELCNISENQNNSLISEVDILKNDTKKIKFTSIDDIIKIIKKYNSNFNKKDYNISKTSGITTVDITNNIIDDSQQIVSFQFKIGDFNTNTGYVAIINNGMIEEIYDNTKPINIELDKESFLIENNTVKNKIEIYKKSAELEAKKKSINNGITSNVTKQNTSFYYDIETNKKYIIIDSTVESKEYNNGKAVGIESSLYEI